MVDFLTTAWMTADSPNPRISAQVIAHVIDTVMDSAWTMACTNLTSRAPSADVTPVLHPVNAPKGVKVGPHPPLHGTISYTVLEH
jgi:hypothetical protein